MKNESMKLYVVTAVDISETSDHKGHVIATFDNRDAAIGYIREDMEAFQMDSDDLVEVDYDKMSAYNEDYSYGCEWSIEEVEWT